MRRFIFHVDMDAFYASIEQRDDPSLKGKPVVVGADPRQGLGRGVVAACSYEARRFGIHSAQPISKAYRLCPTAAFLRPSISRYKEVSRKIYQILVEFSDKVEQVSIDEAYLDLSSSLTDATAALAAGRDLKRRIREEETLTASVGIGPNKFIAKIASDLEKPDGLVMVAPDQVQAFLGPLPVSRLAGVGPRTEERLKALAISKIEDLSRMDPRVLERRLGSLGRHLWNLALGQDERPVVADREAKSISQERTYLEDTSDTGILNDTIQRLSLKVGESLARHGLRARTVHIKLRYSDFTTLTRQVTLRDPASGPSEILAAARELFHRHREPARRVRLVGVGVSKLEPSLKPRQLSLF